MGDQMVVIRSILVFALVSAVSAGLDNFSAAATFVGQTNAIFRVTETLDGTVSSADKTGPLEITLNTDYRTMRWSLDFDVDLVMAGGPGESFETRLAASGSLTSRRCVPGQCSILGDGEPSTLTFPNQDGRSGAGSYILLGSAEWTLTDRIVSVVRERHSAERAISASGGVSGDSGYSNGIHYIWVKDYPPHLELTPGSFAPSSWQDDLGEWRPDGTSGVQLGRLVDSGSNISVSMLGFSRVILEELLSGDFNGSGIVDASDYVVWRDADGPLAGFLTNEIAWRANFGANIVDASEFTNVPEPNAVVAVVIAAWLLSVAARTR